MSPNLARLAMAWTGAWLIGETIVTATAYLGRSPFDSLPDGLDRAHRAGVVWSAFTTLGFLASAAWLR